jgi:hypothetical protein
MNHTASTNQRLGRLSEKRPAFPIRKWARCHAVLIAICILAFGTNHSSIIRPGSVAHFKGSRFYPRQVPWKFSRVPNLLVAPEITWGAASIKPGPLIVTNTEVTSSSLLILGFPTVLDNCVTGVAYGHKALSMAEKRVDNTLTNVFATGCDADLCFKQSLCAVFVSPDFTSRDALRSTGVTYGYARFRAKYGLNKAPATVAITGDDPCIIYRDPSGSGGA